MTAGGALTREEAKNEDAVKWWGEWSRLRSPFYSSGGWESGSSSRVADGGGANSMFRFRLEERGDGTKHYRKMKWRQQACLGSMGRKCDTVRRCGNICRRRGGTGEGKGSRR
jgi:hypothetical protein